MATTQDASVTLAVESTYGTPVTTTRALEFTTESLTFNKNVKQGQGLRVGGRVARSTRRVVASADASGDLSMEAISKGMGLVWQGCLGSSTSTLVSGSTYQQVHTLGDTPPSWTVQKGLPEAGGSVDAYTFVGVMVSQWVLNFPNADFASLQVSLDCKDVQTGVAYAAPSYTAGSSLFHFAGGAITSGTLTAPTTTTLASGATTIADVRGGSLTVNNNLAVDRYTFGSAGRKTKPTVGLRDITGSLTVEYDTNTWRDAVLLDTPLNLVLTFTGAALSTGLETLQVVLPAVQIESPLSQTNGTDLITTDLSFTALDNLTAAQPIWVVTRTADTAL